MGGPSAWSFEGTAAHGVDAGLGFAHSGTNNGWIRCTCTGWSALTQQVPVTPGTTYTFSAWVRSSPSLTDAAFGVRPGSRKVMAQQAISMAAEPSRHAVRPPA